jgi:hypothetical protein
VPLPPGADAWRSALGGGVPGAAAMALQVLLLCWLRAITHYQYAKGGSMLHAARTLWAQGGVPRFYQGLLPALVQAPLCRFGDTAANAGALALLARTRAPLPLKTAAASAAASAWRAAITPLDTVKVVIEVEGLGPGAALLRRRVAAAGLRTLYAGAAGSAASAAAAHWPWFLTHNALQPRWCSPAPGRSRAAALWRQAAAGFAASLVSDVVANPLRVLKAAVQTAEGELGYGGALAQVLAQGGVAALLTRGLGAKLCVNALQGVVFSVLWRACQDALAARRAAWPPTRLTRDDLEAACAQKGQ